jgi:uncharacterized protein (TIGR03437 family)
MRAALWLLAALVFPPLARAGETARYLAPSYSAASIVNNANNLSGALAPNTIVTLYGENLAYTTRALVPGDLTTGRIPTALPGTGVRVLIRNVPAGIYFVSPNQINLLVPSNLVPGDATLQLVQDGHAGPEVRIRLRSAAPGLYQLDPETVIAMKSDGTVATADNPARPGEVIVLYATGLGEVSPPLAAGEIPRAPASLKRLSEFNVFLDGAPVDPGRVLYAGVTPGFAGLYQINLHLPETAPDHPEVRVAAGEEISGPGVYLPVQAR